MAEDILIFSKFLQLLIFITLIFNQITNSCGLDDLKDKFCPSLISTTSTNFKCKYNGAHVENCENPRNGTTVLISCNRFNEESSLQDNPIRLCMNGKWSSDIPECYSTPIQGVDVSEARYKPKPDDQNSSQSSCPSLTSTHSTNFTCVYKNTVLKSCQNPVNGTIGIVSCSPFYKRDSFEENSNLICRNGRWSSAIPQCYPSHSESNLFVGPHNEFHRIYCPPLTPSISTNFECKHNVKPREDCLNPVHNTTVLISCNPSYEEPSLAINPIRLCQNGVWSSAIPQCYPSNREVPAAIYDPSIQLSSSHRNCRSLTSTTTTNVRCEHNGRPLQNCENPIDGTTVLISCNSPYQEESLRSNPIRICKDGKWSSSIPQCYSKNNCQSLTLTKSTNYKCEHNGRPLVNCQNPIHGTIVLISCNPFYEEPSLKTNPIRICRNGKWSSSIPQCYAKPSYGVNTFLDFKFNPFFGDQAKSPSVCPSLISTTSTNFQCIHNNIPLNNCENATNGTLVIISCNSFYEESSLQNNPIRTCRNGKWSSTIPQCSPICGKVPAKVLGISNQSLGSKNALHDYPWHVGIYNNAKKYLCGGTIIIKPKIILTVAHCVTNEDGKLMHPSDYLVAAGKYYRNYDDPRDKYAQYAKVSEIHIPTGYKWSITALPFDVAVLVLKEPFTFSIAVQPVCLELNNKTENLHTLVNNTGIVTGWGSIERGGSRSEVLKDLIIPYVPFSQCYQEIQEPWRVFLTKDKICGGYIQNGGVICHGDGGGGFIFKNVVDDRYYIEAVLSVGLFNEFNECYSNQYTAYTSVFYTSQFLKSVITTL